MAASSRYLSTPLRTLRQACRELSAERAGLSANDCKACPNRNLCAINERLERRRRTELAFVGSHTVRRRESDRSPKQN